MTPRNRMILVVAVTIAPMIVCAVAAALPLLEHERRVMERDAVGRARSAMSAVDAHLNGTLLALRTLAASKNLEAGDVAAFHAETQRVLKGDPAWVNISLMAPTEEVLFNAVYSYGKPEPKPPLNDSWEATAKGTKVAVSGVRPGSVVRNPTVRVNLPVQVKGQPGYILIAPLNLKQIADVLQAQKLPESWTIMLVDRDKQVIAAIPHAPTGAAAPEAIAKAIGRSPDGWSRGGGPEGAPYTAHATSSMSNWVLAVGIPPEYVEADARRSLRILGVGIVLALVVGVAFAGAVAKSATSPG
jgi:hypothetical protein